MSSKEYLCVGRRRTVLETVFLWSGQRSGSALVGRFRFRFRVGEGRG